MPVLCVKAEGSTNGGVQTAVDHGAVVWASLGRPGARICGMCLCGGFGALGCEMPRRARDADRGSEQGLGSGCPEAQGGGGVGGNGRPPVPGHLSAGLRADEHEEPRRGEAAGAEAVPGLQETGGGLRRGEAQGQGRGGDAHRQAGTARGFCRDQRRSSQAGEAKAETDAGDEHCRRPGAGRLFQGLPGTGVCRPRPRGGREQGKLHCSFTLVARLVPSILHGLPPPPSSRR